jgi:hypothetical protein
LVIDARKDISGIAGKAGFDNIRTFISNKNNGMMFEVKFGPAIPSSVEGPFEPKSNPQVQSNLAHAIADSPLAFQVAGH